MTTRTLVTIDRKAVRQNVASVFARSRKRIFAVVKNNAYNLGMLEMVETLMASDEIGRAHV